MTVRTETSISSVAAACAVTVLVFGASIIAQSSATAAGPAAQSSAKSQGGCVATRVHRGAPPAWTAPAWADSSPGFTLPYALSSGDAAAAFFFANPLRAGHPTNPHNKILWVVRYPRNGKPLNIVARSPTDPGKTVRASWPADSEPGEIYPSYVDLPKPGCWELTLSWDTHTAHLDLQVQRPIHSPNVAAGASIAAELRRPLHLPHVLPGGRCPASGLHDLGNFVSPGLGPGPVYPVLGSGLGFVYSPPAGGTALFAGSQWGGTKVLWTAASSYRGPVLIRGRELDGPHEVRFGDARIPAAEMRLSVPGAYSVGEPAGWREWPSYTRLQAGGCYAYQVDGTRFSIVIVFRALSAARARLDVTHS
jgi:hypothetical protein